MSDANPNTLPEECPCGSGAAFADCCGPIIAGERLAPTAEALMRSRYSAFVVHDVDYLRESLTPETRDDFDREHVEAWSNEADWQGLEIRSTEAGGEEDEEGWVEYIARFKIKGRLQTHHESSFFVRRDGRWYYQDGILGTRPVKRTGPKVGRNDPCPCGSGKKYKKCHGAAA